MNRGRYACALLVGVTWSGKAPQTVVPNSRWCGQVLAANLRPTPFYESFARTHKRFSVCQE